MLEELNTKIETFKATESEKRAELKRLEDDKRKHKEEQDREINNLKAMLIKIKKDEEDDIKALEAKENNEIKEENAKHEQKLKNLDTKVKEAEKELLETEQKNRGVQTEELKKLMDQLYTQRYVSMVMNSYDTEMEKEEELLQEAKAEFDKYQTQLVQVEDEYRRVKHEKEVNSAIETEWKIKIEVAFA